MSDHPATSQNPGIKEVTNGNVGFDWDETLIFPPNPQPNTSADDAA